MKQNFLSGVRRFCKFVFVHSDEFSVFLLGFVFGAAAGVALTGGWPLAVLATAMFLVAALIGIVLLLSLSGGPQWFMDFVLGEPNDDVAGGPSNVKKFPGELSEDGDEQPKA